MSETLSHKCGHFVQVGRGKEAYLDASVEITWDPEVETREEAVRRMIRGAHEALLEATLAFNKNQELRFAAAGATEIEREN